MFSRSLSMAQAYSSVGVASGAMSASPHGLVLMLYDGAMVAIAAARMHLQLNQHVEKSKAVSKAVTIISDGLMASLDMDAGGALAERLFALYEYMVSRLIDANVQNNGAALDEVARLLGELSGAWKQIGSTAQPAAAHHGS
jgi:flagellar protein FliS